MLDITDVAKQAGTTTSALRYYEEIGLIKAVSRRGLRRQFSPDVLLQLKLIAMGQLAGFSLSDIGEMLGDGARSQLPRDRLHQRADDIDRQIHQLTALRQVLRHVADCPAPSHLQCPTFRRLMDVAARRPRGRGKRNAGSYKR